jgi:hypothetical protein
VLLLPPNSSEIRWSISYEYGTWLLIPYAANTAFFSLADTDRTDLEYPGTHTCAAVTGNVAPGVNRASGIGVSPGDAIRGTTRGGALDAARGVATQPAVSITNAVSAATVNHVRLLPLCKPVSLADPLTGQGHRARCPAAQRAAAQCR